MNETPNDICLGVTYSCRGQAWTWRCNDENRVTAISQRGGVDDLTARLLAGRNIAPEDVQNVLDPRIRDFLPNPSSLQDMDVAAYEIVSAVKQGKKITVFADYDVDGGTSAAQIIRWARHFNTEIGLYVPDRVAEGYGPTPEAFAKLKDAGNDLVMPKRW